MDHSNDSSLAPPDLSFESIKKHNQHGVEYWSARDLQPFLGYSQWRYFENAINKAIESCKQSDNRPQNHFAGVRKMVPIGSQTERELAEPIKSVEKRLKTSHSRLTLDPQDAIGIANYIDPCEK